MCGVVANQVLKKYLDHVTESIYSQKTVLLEGKGKNWTQKCKNFHICIVASIIHSESSVAIHLQHTVLLNLKQSLLVLF